MKRFPYLRVSFIFAAISILLIGMFRDADIANADYLNAEPVPMSV